MAKKKFVDDENYDPSQSAAVAVKEEPLLEAPIDMATDIVPLDADIPSIPPKSLAQLAYERMIAQYENPEVEFSSWEEMNPLVRKVFEERAESLECDALFEQCVRQVKENNVSDPPPSHSFPVSSDAEIAPATATNA